VLLHSRTIEVADLSSAGGLCLACDAPAARSESVLADLPCHMVRTDVRMASQMLAGASQKVSGFRFLCHCPHMILLSAKRSGDGRLAREDISLQVTDLPELD
jgi:hypothetical protein